MPGSCNGIRCQCRTGYKGKDCCQCDVGYVIDGQSCRSCPPGMVPNENQDDCICDQSKGTTILVNSKCKRKYFFHFSHDSDSSNVNFFFS